jgi:hypothetical protein
MAHHEPNLKRVYGMAAEFTDVDEILMAAERARDAGYKRMDAYTPFPVHGLSEAIGFHENTVPWLVFIGGLVGATAGLSLQYYVSVLDYPMNIGGRPLFSLPQFVPITFECTILFASLTAFFGMLGMNQLPQPYHPIFNASNFGRASQDRFFLCIESDDALFDETETRSFLESLNPQQVSLVEA